MIKIQKAFMSALIAGAQSGDECCKFIVTAIQKQTHTQVFKGPANNFRLVIEQEITSKKTPKIVYTPVDPKHTEIQKRIAKDPYYLFDRDAEASPAKFLDLFRDFPESLRKDDAAIESFGEVLKLGVKVEYQLMDTMEAFMQGYDEGYYWNKSSCNDTLHSSCMRGMPHAQICAEFYALVCRAKILLATHDGRTVGRAVVWPEVVFTATDGNAMKCSLLSRVYYTHAAVRDGLFREARKLGINFRLAGQTYNCDSVVVLNPVNQELKSNQRIALQNAMVRLHAHPDFHGGTPYVDFFPRVVFDVNAGGLYLAKIGTTRYRTVAQCQSTHGTTEHSSVICPVCGAIDTPCECLNTAAEPISYQELVPIQGYGLVPKSCTQDCGLFGYGLTEKASSSLLLRLLAKENFDENDDEYEEEDDL